MTNFGYYAMDWLNLLNQTSYLIFHSVLQLRAHNFLRWKIFTTIKTGRTSRHRTKQYRKDKISLLVRFPTFDLSISPHCFEQKPIATDVMMNIQRVFGIASRTRDSLASVTHNYGRKMMFKGSVSISHIHTYIYIFLICLARSKKPAAFLAIVFVQRSNDT